MSDPQLSEDNEPPQYDRSFFEALEEGVRRSADVAAGPIMEIIRPRSAVDLGCGTGIWLAALRVRGVEDILGIDGPWVPREQLAIPEDLFWQHDLTKAFRIDRRFDLALCLETAEHLPAEAAPVLVETLTRLAPVVVFSGAVPEQKGQGHVNEQWPEYWINLFAERGYLCSTALRDLLWNDERVDVWYRQNLLCFAEPTHAPLLEPLFGQARRAAPPPLNVVHPGLFLRDSENLRKYADYTAHLESRLSETRDDLQRTRDDLQRGDDLQRMRHELWRIKNSLAYRAYARVKTAWRFVRRTARL